MGHVDAVFSSENLKHEAAVWPEKCFPSMILLLHTKVVCHHAMSRFTKGPAHIRIGFCVIQDMVWRATPKGQQN